MHTNSNTSGVARGGSLGSSAAAAETQSRFLKAAQSNPERFAAGADSPSPSSRKAALLRKITEGLWPSRLEALKALLKPGTSRAGLLRAKARGGLSLL